MASQPARQIAYSILAFLLFVATTATIVECGRRYLERKIGYNGVIEQCTLFVSDNPAIKATFGTPTNVVHEKTGGGFTWSPEGTDGRDVFVVNGTKSNGTIKVHWRDGKQDGFEVLKISITEPWEDDTVIWTRAAQ